MKYFNNNMLYQKYRPESWSAVTGQVKTIKDLQKRASSKMLPQSLILSGYTGTGKTTIARLIAKSIACKQLKESGEPCNKCDECLDINNSNFRLSYREINASNLDIDSVRGLEEELRNGSMLSDFQIIFIDEFQALVKSSPKASQNILKILEDPIENIYLMLGTMDLASFHEAVPGRCLIYHIKKLTSEEIFNTLGKVCQAEKIKPSNEKAKALEMISKFSKGSLRNALSYLDRCISSDIWTEDELIEELHLASLQKVTSIAKLILNDDIKIFSQTLYFNKSLIESLRDTLLIVLKIQYGGYIPKEDVESVKEILSLKPAPRLLEIISLLSEALKNYYLDRATIELTIFKCMNLKAPREKLIG